MSFLSDLFNTGTKTLFTVANEVTVDREYFEYLLTVEEDLEGAEEAFDEIQKDWEDQYTYLMSLACLLAEENMSLRDEVDELEHLLTEQEEALEESQALVTKFRAMAKFINGL